MISNTSTATIGVVITPPQISRLYECLQSSPKRLAVHGGGTSAEEAARLFGHVQWNGADGEKGNGDACLVRPVRIYIAAVCQWRCSRQQQSAHLPPKNGQYDGGCNGADHHHDVRLENRVWPPSGHLYQILEKAVKTVEDNDD